MGISCEKLECEQHSRLLLRRNYSPRRNFSSCCQGIAGFGFNEDENKKGKKNPKNPKNLQKGTTRKFLLKVFNFSPVAVGAWSSFFILGFPRAWNKRMWNFRLSREKKFLKILKRRKKKKKDFCLALLVLGVTGREQSFAVDPSWVSQGHSENG